MFLSFPSTSTSIVGWRSMCTGENSLLPAQLRSPWTNSLQFSQNLGKNKNGGNFLVFCCSNSSDSTTMPTPILTTQTNSPSPMTVKKRKRYRKMYPGESKGIVEEMRFVAMKLRNDKSKNKKNIEEIESDDEEDSSDESSDMGETWEPSIEGFLKYLVDSKLIFETLDRIVDESNHVSYAYFTKTGLERSEGLSKDLEWFNQNNILIPQPSPPGLSYAKYLEELAEKSAPLFLCHFYNVYFAHIAGGQEIAKQVSDKLMEGEELEFFTWEGNVQEMLKDVREKLNKLGEHWTRDEKNKCLREASKSFRYLGQIVRLIIL